MKHVHTVELTHALCTRHCSHAIQIRHPGHARQPRLRFPVSQQHSCCDVCKGLNEEAHSTNTASLSPSHAG
jgi:hypothetical protein